MNKKNHDEFPSPKTVEKGKEKRKRKQVPLPFSWGRQHLSTRYGQMIYGAKGIASKMRAQTFSETLHKSLCKCKKKNSPAFSLIPSPKCRDTENKEKLFLFIILLVSGRDGLRHKRRGSSRRRGGWVVSIHGSKQAERIGACWARSSSA